MKYIDRIIDKRIDKLEKAFDAICIVGPKGSGKTRSAKERCKTIIEFQNEDRREGYLRVANSAPSLLLDNEKPILFDEWQDAPKIWGTVRKACDDTDKTGEYFLTGSTSANIDVPHSGTGRITTIEMYPMTLYETGESNGRVSLSEIIKNPNYKIDGKSTDLDIKKLIYATCRGGWPRTLTLKSADSKLEIARDYFKQICEKDISMLDGVKRNSDIARTLLLSYSRNIATTVKTSSIIADVRANYNIGDSTFYEYSDALRRLYVIKDIDAWMPQIRSKSAIRSAKKRIFVDPSIAIASLNLEPEYFYNDFDMFGHVFENLVFRDLLAFASVDNSKVMHYRDDYGLEIDAVYRMADGKYALIEVKTGSDGITKAEKNLLKLKNLIKEYNAKDPEVPYKEPSALIVICAAANMAYTLDSGVKIVPIGCLKN